jgi:hypothetical protein
MFPHQVRLAGKCLSAFSGFLGIYLCKSHHMGSTWNEPSIRSFQHSHQGPLPISLQSEGHLPTKHPNVIVVSPGRSPILIPSASEVALVRSSIFSLPDRVDEVQLTSEHLWSKTLSIPVFVTEALRYEEKVLVGRNDVAAQVQRVV